MMKLSLGGMNRVAGARALNRCARFAMQVAGCLLALNTAQAELPIIRLDRIQPMGAAAGTSVDVELNAAEDDEATQLLFDHPGIKAESLAPRKFKITIAADVPSGTFDVWLSGRFGVSNPRLFQVTRGLAEVAEAEPNNIPDKAQVIAVNSVVSAFSDQNEFDQYRIPLEKGARVTIDCQASNLESLLDGVMTLSGPDGRLLASSGDYFGRDPFLDFVAETTGEYVVAVSDLSYRGGQQYRLVVSSGPQIENIFPQVIEAGKASELVALGRNLGSAAENSPRTVDGLPLQLLRYSVTPAQNVTARGQYLYQAHPLDHTVLPTAATCTLTGIQALPPLENLNARGQSLVVSEDPVQLENEPNDDIEHAQLIALPVAISGRFDRARDVDYYKFEPAQAGPVSIEVFCERIAGRADPYLIVTDDQGNVVLETDDFGHRVNAFDGHLRDPIGQFNTSEKRKYFITVGDRYSRGGARLQYVLAVRAPRPDFFVAAIHRQNPQPTGLSLLRGGAEYLDIVIHRWNNHVGPITLTAHDLPAGVHSIPTTIQDGQKGTLVFWSDRAMPLGVWPVRVTASGKRGDATIERDVRPYSRSWNDASMNSSRPMRTLYLASCGEAPLVVDVAPRQLTVEAGQKATFKAVVTRHWPGIAAIRLAPLSFQGNFNLAPLDLPAGQNEVALEIAVQAGTAPGDYTMALQCQAQVPFSKDPKVEQKPQTLVTLPSLPLTITVTAPPAKK